MSLHSNVHTRTRVSHSARITRTRASPLLSLFLGVSIPPPPSPPPVAILPPHARARVQNRTHHIPSARFDLLLLLPPLASRARSSNAPPRRSILGLRVSRSFRVPSPTPPPRATRTTRSRARVRIHDSRSHHSSLASRTHLPESQRARRTEAEHAPARVDSTRAFRRGVLHTRGTFSPFMTRHNHARASTHVLRVKTSQRPKNDRRGDRPTDRSTDAATDRWTDDG